MKAVRKKTVLGAMLLSSMIALNTTALAQTIIVNGNNVVSNESVTVDKGVTMVPLRVISENLGVKVDFEKATGTITLSSDRVTVVLVAGKNQAKVNNETVVMQRPAVIKNGRTLVPLRFVGEALEAVVHYDSATGAITVTSKNGETIKKPTTPVTSQGPTDVYGRKIRTTNLPKNADWFPYIAEGIPNWAYEQQPYDDNYWGYSRNTLAPEGASKTAMLPKHIHDSSESISKVLPDRMDEMNKFLEAYLNVDYRTIDKEYYTETLVNSTAITPKSTSIETRAEMKAWFGEYADYIIANKVIIESEFEIMPETTWTTVDNQIGMLNFSVYTKMKPVQVLNGKVFDMPGVMQINKTKSPVYPNGVKKSSIKAGQELEGIFSVTLLRVGMNDWKVAYGDMQPLLSLNPLNDVANGVAPNKKSKDRVTEIIYSWDETKFYTRNDKNTTIPIK